MEMLEIIKNRLNNEERGFDNGEYLRLEDVSWLVEKVEELQKDIDFFKKKQEVNNVITQELVALNDRRVIDILTKTRIIGGM